MPTRNGDLLIRDTNLRELPFTETEWLDAHRRLTGMTERQVRDSQWQQPWTLKVAPTAVETSASTNFYSTFSPTAIQNVPQGWWQQR